MGTRPTTDEEHKYLTELGFSYAEGCSQYCRQAGDWHHYLSANADRKTPQLLYWNAVSAKCYVNPPVDSSSLQMVVQHVEHFTSPISCFVTAEVRQWRRPEAS